jgi:hypothetical protein
MHISEIENIKYITNDRGDKIEAVIPIDIWYELLAKISSVELSARNRDDSGLEDIWKV